MHGTLRAAVMKGLNATTFSLVVAPLDRRCSAGPRLNRRDLMVADRKHPPQARRARRKELLQLVTVKEITIVASRAVKAGESDALSTIASVSSLQHQMLQRAAPGASRNHDMMMMCRHAAL